MALWVDLIVSILPSQTHQLKLLSVTLAAGIQEQSTENAKENSLCDLIRQVLDK